MTSTPGPFSARGGQDTDRQDLCSTFETALVYLNRGIEQLRSISPTQANRAARQINIISEIVLEALLQCDSPRRFIESPKRSDDSHLIHNEGQTEARGGGVTLPRDLQENHRCPPASHRRETARGPNPAGLAERAPNVQTGYQAYLTETAGGSQRKAVPAAQGPLDPFPPLSTNLMTTTLETGVGNDTIQTSCCSCGGHKTTSIPPMQSVSNVEEEEQKQSFGSGEYLDCLEYSGPSSLNDENRMTADSGTWTASQPQNKTTANAAPFAATWAKVAAIKPTEPVSFGRSQRSATFPLSNGPARPTRKYSVARQSEPIAEQGRVVWLVNCPEKMTLREVSKKIIEGALMSVVFVDDHDEICPGRAACVIFQKAEAAQEFYEANRAVPPEGQTSKYGKGVRVEMGGNFPADEDIQSMNMFPNGARRRLTFVRSQLFVGLSRARFERDIKAIAGADNVELIHIYNTGNATVVLASVKVAKALLKHFQMYAARDGPYKDVEVSYSKDPCEAEMRLISAFMG